MPEPVEGGLRQAQPAVLRHLHKIFVAQRRKPQPATIPMPEPVEGLKLLVQSAARIPSNITAKRKDEKMSFAKENS
jgi:hypothetical protein